MCVLDLSLLILWKSCNCYKLKITLKINKIAGAVVGCDFHI